MVKPFFKSTKQYRKLLEEHVEALSSLQRLHYASNRYALLLIFQAMDAAGKDGAIRHVMSGNNPQGCQVFSFKQPSAEDLEHDFLWRTTCRLPDRGHIGIFNRSYYEEVLVVRVHPEILRSQGLKKPPAWNLWQLQKLGFKGHADVYMGVFWNNKRRRVGAIYPYATIAFSGTPSPGDVVSFSIGGTTVAHAIGYGESLQQIASHMCASINGMFSGVWADDNFGTSTTLRIQSTAPSWTFTRLAVSAPNSVRLTLSNHMATAGSEGVWEMTDGISPVMTEGARAVDQDLAGFRQQAFKSSFAFSMECYLPPAAIRGKYLSYTGDVVASGADVDLGVPSHRMHFGTRVRNYLKQMDKECADKIEAAGLPVVLQFGETQWWYFDNTATDPNGGMPYYDAQTVSDFAVVKGHQIWPFGTPTEDPKGDLAHSYETADFLRDRIWAYCQDVITYVRSYHPTAVFECLWPRRHESTPNHGLRTPSRQRCRGPSALRLTPRTVYPIARFVAHRLEQLRARSAPVASPPNAEQPRRTASHSFSVWPQRGE